MIADDAPFIREIVRTVAERNNLSLVGEAVDGIDAINQALTAKPDIILMDIIMPRKSGIEATSSNVTRLSSLPTLTLNLGIRTCSVSTCNAGKTQGHVFALTTTRLKADATSG